MLDEPITAKERLLLQKLATGNYLLKFGQLYRKDHITLYPEGAARGVQVEHMLKKGLIEKITLHLAPGIYFNCHTITAYARKRLERGG